MALFFSSRRQREVFEPLPWQSGYGAENALQRNRGKLGTAFFFFMLMYILTFQVIGRFIPIYFIFPLGLLLLVVIWALPETGRAPTKLLSQLFYFCLVGALFWPDYFAIALPSLPWITVLRLTAIPMTLVLLIALSVSKPFREQLKAVTASVRGVMWLLIAFTLLITISVLYSSSIFHSFNRLVNGLVGWTVMYFVSCYVFSQPGQARRVAAIIWGATAFWLAMSLWEWRLGHVPWQGHIPSFLQTDDEIVQRVLEGMERTGGAYRIQTKFFTPISYAEFLALASPFILHWMMTAERALTRFAAAATLPLIFVTIVGTDSRLGAGGFMMTFMVYALAWGVRRWRYTKGSLFGPAIVLAYPVLFAAFIGATFVVGRLHAMVWGGGRHVSSNEARQVQIEMAIPLLKSHPWGYGIGMSGSELGYTTPGGMLTIDSYYLSMLLDAGFLGFTVYFTMFLWAIWQGGKHSIAAPEGDALWIMPATIALINFVIIKSVLSQIENHTLVFTMLGMIVALCWQIQNQHGSTVRQSGITKVPAGSARSAKIYE